MKLWMVGGVSETNVLWHVGWKKVTIDLNVEYRGINDTIAISSFTCRAVVIGCRIQGHLLIYSINVSLIKWESCLLDKKATF